ncbi:hypothetical protein ABT56_01260 [Photobacterium aquae]|uniref:diguanylate cyclase n=1 Tax=Photobacterium aquae TaxID=1195763 RepID=A0A0J1HB59_9GAMM|nr:diguanylate cyclase [Photobacterium aquae]KLV08876.1 hypothetical protein ABT56_01260 [Photobacterium aquae]
MRCIVPLVTLVMTALIYMAVYEYQTLKGREISHATDNVTIASAYLGHHYSSAAGHLYLLEQLWLAEEDPQLVIKAAERILQGQNTYLEIALLADGNYVATGGFSRYQVNGGVSERPWYIKDAPLGQYYVSRLYYSKSMESWTVSIVKVLNDRHRDIRFVLEINVNQIYANLAGLKTSANGYFYAVEAATNRIIMHPDPSRIASSSVSYLTGEQLPLPGKKDHPAKLLNYSYQGNDKFSVFHPVSRYGWVVFSGTAQSEILWQTLGMGVSTVALVAMILLALFLSLISRRIHQYGSELNEVRSMDKLYTQLQTMVREVLGSSQIALVRYDENTQTYQVYQSDCAIDKKTVRGLFADSQYRIQRLPALNDDPFVTRLFACQSCLRVPLTNQNKLIGILYIRTSQLLLPQFANILRNYTQSALNHVRLTQRIKNTDAMTGLMNKRYLCCRVEAQLTRDSRHYLAMLDIDDFKRINDTHGHLFGDKVILEVATILKESCDQQCVVARYGGEEFAVLFPASCGKQAASIMNKVRQRLNQTVISDDKKRCVVTVSIGVAAVEDSVDSTIARADLVLYRVKSQGKNQVLYYQERLYGDVGVMNLVKV